MHIPVLASACASNALSVTASIAGRLLLFSFPSSGLVDLYAHTFHALLELLDRLVDALAGAFLLAAIDSRHGR